MEFCEKTFFHLVIKSQQDAKQMDAHCWKSLRQCLQVFEIIFVGFDEESEVNSLVQDFLENEIGV